MKILAIETSSTACSIALYNEGEILSFHQDAPMQQTKMLLPEIDKLLQQAGLTIRDIDTFACGCGPGSFTGVRIAVSVIQGLAFGSDAPVILISSLAAAAQAAYDKHQWKNLLVAIDARVNEIYTANYLINAEGLAELQGSEEILSPSLLVGSGNFYAAGNGWANYKDLITINPLDTDPNVIPTAEAVLKLALKKYTHKDWVKAENATPIYLRNKVAEKQKKT